MPIIMMILVGVLARRSGYLTKNLLRGINKFTFRFAFTALMFVNIYEIKSIRDMPLDLAVFALLALTFLLFVGFVFSKIVTKERFRRGVLIQATFRSNYAVIGLPVVATLVGDAGVQMASFLQLPVVTFYNFMSVIVLSIFEDFEAQYRLYGEGPLADAAASGQTAKAIRENNTPAGKDRNPTREMLVRILKGTASNPLIQGLLLGFLVLIIRQFIPLRGDGELVFSLKRNLPWLYDCIYSLSRVATPMALIVLGGQLEMKEIGSYRKELIAGILARLAGAPLIGFSLLFAAARMGLLTIGPVETAVFVAVFASPLSVSSIVMSQEMGGDSHLAGQIVVWTSIFGMFSLFVIIFLLRLQGLL